MPELVWDESKRISNILKHGLDFAELQIDFFVDATVLEGRTGRLIAVGWHNERPTTVVFVYLGLEAISVISMRVASERERRLLWES